MKLSKKCQVSNWMGDRLREYILHRKYNDKVVSCLDTISNNLQDDKI